MKIYARCCISCFNYLLREIVIYVQALLWLRKHVQKVIEGFFSVIAYLFCGILIVAYIIKKLLSWTRSLYILNEKFNSGIRGVIWQFVNIAYLYIYSLFYFNSAYILTWTSKHKHDQYQTYLFFLVHAREV